MRRSNSCARHCGRSAPAAIVESVKRPANSRRRSGNYARHDVKGLTTFIAVARTLLLFCLPFLLSAGFPMKLQQYMTALTWSVGGGCLILGRQRPEKIKLDLRGGMPMATYEYRCPDCGRFEVHLPIGTATATGECPACHRPSPRVFSSPYLSRVPSAVAAALTREERSQEAPEVITSAPPKRREPPPHPALARLPRP